MRIGVPKEIKVLENRVGLTPGSVRELVQHGHSVIVERDAGQGIGVSDADYRREGASIATTAAELFASCEMIVKVKEPQAAERAMLRAGQIQIYEPGLEEMVPALHDAAVAAVGRQMRGKELRREAVQEPAPRLWPAVDDGQILPAEGDDP